MRRALVFVGLVLVLGAWGPCAPPTTSGGHPMAGPTTSGLAALQAGEDWQYVAGPDFQNGWGAVTPIGQLFYRYREPGFVDVIGVVDGGTPGSVITTLPEGYRPSANVFVNVTGDTTAGGGTSTSVGILWLYASGDLQGDRNPTEQAYINISGSFPVLAP